MDMTRVVEILPQVRQELDYSAVNITGAAVLATYGIRASDSMLLTMMNQINSIPAR